MKMDDTDKYQVTIIGNVQKEFKEAYHLVTHQFRGKIDFLTESECQTFQMHLTTLINSNREEEDLRWMFLTDDCVLLEPLSVIMEKAPSADVFLTRLHPGITWCQTRNLPSPPPRSQLRYQSSCYSYPLLCGQVDWAYPWDLSGGIYRNNLVQEVFSKIDEEARSHPNKLEKAGHSILRGKSSMNIFIPLSPMLLILSLNRVQDVYFAPLDNVTNPLEMLCFLKEERRLALNEYRAQHFNSSHISELILEELRPVQSIDISVLMPVHKGPPDAAKLAIKSVIMQCKEQSMIRYMQVIIVDDRCADGSIEALVDAAKDFASKIHKTLVVDDYRRDEKIEVGCSEIIVEIHRSLKPGIAAALNHGLQYARYEFVARMDADDICDEQRFLRQIECLRRNQTLNVVGTQSVVFSRCIDSEKMAGNELRINMLPFSEESYQWKVRPSLPPTDPGFVAWAILFSCCISHPSVMFRKRIVIDAGGYNEKAGEVEDYDLWLRLTQADPLSVGSIPHVGLWHRKHHGKSERTIYQEEQAHAVALQRINEYLGSSNLLANLFVLRPDLAPALADLDHAAHVLITLQTIFQERHQNNISGRESKMITFDCMERLGEIATLSLIKFGDVKSKAWVLWCDMCPERALEQLALLCHVPSNRDLVKCEH